MNRASPGFTKDVKSLHVLLEQLLPPPNTNMLGSTGSGLNNMTSGSTHSYSSVVESTAWDSSSLISLLKEVSSDASGMDETVVTRCILIFARNHYIPLISPQEVWPIHVTNPFNRPTSSLPIKISDFSVSNPNCIIDILYLHEKASESNHVQEIYEALGLLENDQVSRSYEVTKSHKRLLMATTELLANPSFRSKRKDAHRWPLQ